MYMDADNLISNTEENGSGCENRVNTQPPTSEEHALMEKLKVDVESSPSELLDVFLPAKEQNDDAYSSKELGVIEQAVMKDDKPHKGAAQTKNLKLTSLKTATTTHLKKGKNGKNVTNPTASNGTIASGPHVKLASGLSLKSKSSNDEKTAALRIDDYKAPIAANVNGPKNHEQAHPTSRSTTVLHHQTDVEKTKLRLVKKSGSSKSEGTAQSSSPTSSEEKTRNIGGLPVYGFSFKCDERAEKRREFYSKLEEKIQAKEAEKSNLQAKSKETHEAELKMLRKSLMFKATPMPSFYQEPAPLKSELKKIPPTRAKSPRLGRKKSSVNAASEEDIDARTHPSKSLDENLPHSILAAKGGFSINIVKKPLRTSLPKLPSQKITHNETKRSSARINSLSKDTTETAAADLQEQEAEETIIDHSKTQIINKNEPLVESHA